MKILLINSNTTEHMTKTVTANAQKVASSDTQIVGMTAKHGPATVEGHVDALIAASATVELIAQHEADFDAFIIACGVDPGLFPARELTSKPVVGIGESAMLMACSLAYRFAILTPQQRLVEVLRHQVHQYGLISRLTAIYPVALSVAAVAQDQNAAIPAFLEAAQRAIAEGAGAIMLGGASSSGMDKALQLQLGVPILDGTACAVLMAESLVRLGLGTANRGAFAPPEPNKRTVGIPAAYQRWYDLN
jgi:allantoin racemase